ncbi:hypothetical protein GIB67_001705, partial [Kingdonia uniflora]
KTSSHWSRSPLLCPLPLFLHEIHEINLLLSFLYLIQIFLRLTRKDMGFPSHNPTIIGKPNLVGTKFFWFCRFSFPRCPKSRILLD